MSSLLLTVAPIAATLLAGVLTAHGLARVFGPPPATDRLVSLDGLRGYLALGVFLCHAMAWRHYLVEGRWLSPAPDSVLYRNLGEDSVTLFFMMTGFLFGAKLIGGRARAIDWQRLYVARLLRIYPLYAVVLAAVLAVVARLSAFHLRTPPGTLARNVVSWGHFGEAPLNAVGEAWMITAGAQWSLAYEWMFYSALPFAALLFGGAPRVRWLAASAAAVALWAHWITNFDPLHLASFGAGVLAAACTGRAPVRDALAGRTAALAALGALTVAVTRFDHGYQWPVVTLLAVTFVVVAAGNTLFGVLRWTPSRVLGEISYSIYLLHGLVLFVVVRGVLGPAAAALSPLAYWGLVVGLVPVLVVGCFVAFRLVEQPAIRFTPHAHRWVAERLAGRRSAAGGAGAP